MPFTPSHIAAILPLRARGDKGLVFAALAAGSMSPDFCYYLPISTLLFTSPPTHSVGGILTWDLLYGWVMWLAWRFAAVSLHDLAPDPIRSRWQPAKWPTAVRAWLLVVLSVLVGTTTHVLWDEFTHAGRFGAIHIALIAATYTTPLGAFQGHQILQYASGAIGLLIVIWVGILQPSKDRGPRPSPKLARITVWLVSLSALVAGAIQIFALAGRTGLRAMAFPVITTAIATALLTLALITAGHALLSCRRTRLRGKTKLS